MHDPKINPIINFLLFHEYSRQPNIVHFILIIFQNILRSPRIVLIFHLFSHNISNSINFSWTVWIFTPFWFRGNLSACVHRCSLGCFWTTLGGKYLYLFNRWVRAVHCLMHLLIWWIDFHYSFEFKGHRPVPMLSWSWRAILQHGPDKKTVPRRRDTSRIINRVFIVIPVLSRRHFSVGWLSEMRSGHMTYGSGSHSALKCIRDIIWSHKIYSCPMILFITYSRQAAPTGSRLFLQ